MWRQARNGASRYQFARCRCSNKRMANLAVDRRTNQGPNFGGACQKYALRSP
jgi:hypothetical protein